MSKSTFIPHADHDFLVWTEHLIANLTPDLGLSASELALLQAASDDFRIKTAHVNDAAALAKQATAEKNASRDNFEAQIRAVVRQIKARPDYTEGLGAKLSIIGPENTRNFVANHPDLSGIDQTGGQVTLIFTKFNSDGVNIYCQRENDADWTLLARATVSPFLDNRPLLQVGKPELRRYTAVYMVKDQEIGQYSDDLVINCAP
ncbi:MAG: hypothetical protein QX196_09080 [Methylococcaceae bacterium]|jgi:hypothetical protein